MSGKLDCAQDEAAASGKHLKEATAAKADDLKDQAKHAAKDMKRSAERTADDLKDAAKDAKDSTVHKYEDIKDAADRKIKEIRAWKSSCFRFLYAADWEEARYYTSWLNLIECFASVAFIVSTV